MSDHHQWGDDTLPDDIEDDEMRDDPERIWLEPWDETGHRIWDDDPTTWGDDSVEYVRADLYEAQKASADVWAVHAVEAQEQIDDAARQIAELERRLANLRRDWSAQRDELVEILGDALGYPALPGDGASSANEHTVEALVDQVVHRLAEAEERALAAEGLPKGRVVRRELEVARGE